MTLRAIFNNEEKTEIQKWVYLAVIMIGLSVPLHIPLFCLTCSSPILYLANSYSSFKSQIKCLLLKQDFLVSRVNGLITLCFFSHLFMSLCRRDYWLLPNIHLPYFFFNNRTPVLFGVAICPVKKNTFFSTGFVTICNSWNKSGRVLWDFWEDYLKEVNLDDPTCPLLSFLPVGSRCWNKKWDNPENKSLAVRRTE